VNKLSDFIFKHRYGLLGALLIHLILLLSAKNIVVNQYNRITPEELIEIDFMPEEKLPQETEEKSEEDNQTVVNKAFNLEDKREYSEENYDARYKHLEDQVYKELKEFEKNEFEKLKAGKSTETGLNPVTENTGDKKNKDNNDNEIQNKPTSSGKLLGKTTADFELHMRQKEYLPIPAYKCIGSGTVTIIIKVNRNGKVIDAKINENESSYNEECMREALAYAKRAKFTASSVSPEPQEGKIIYRYIAQ
jgi:TonB family protein